MDAEQGQAGLSTAKGPARPHLHKADSGEQLLGISCHSLPSLPGQECSPLAGSIHTNPVTGNSTMELWKGPARISESNSSAWQTQLHWPRTPHTWPKRADIAELQAPHLAQALMLV